MKIIKKNGTKENFDMGKVRSSVFNASSEINMPLTDSDLNFVEKEVKKTLEILQREETSSYEVFGIVMISLNKLHFDKVGRVYLEGSI